LFCLLSDRENESILDRLLNVIQIALTETPKAHSLSTLPQQYTLPRVAQGTEFDEKNEAFDTYVCALTLQCLKNRNTAQRKGVYASAASGGGGGGGGDDDGDDDKKGGDDKKEEKEEKEEKEGKELVPQLSDLSQFDNCVNYIKESAIQIRRTMYNNDLAEKAKKLEEFRKEQIRREKLEREQKEIATFALTHDGLPDYWNENAIKEHNEKHPDDKYEARVDKVGKPTGMIRGRCLFPQCDIYMKNIGEGQLSAHFKLFGGSYPLTDTRRSWVQGLHKTASNLWRANNGNLTKEQFVQKMEEQLNTQIPTFLVDKYKTEHLPELYDQLKKHGV